MRFLLLVLLLFQIGCGSQETKTKTVKETEIVTVEVPQEFSIFKNWVEYYNSDQLLLSRVDENGYFYAVVNGVTCRPNIEKLDNEIIITEANGCTDLNGTYNYRVLEDVLIIFDNTESFLFTL